jgi:ketosteroid isomerase-like protein
MIRFTHILFTLILLVNACSDAEEWSHQEEELQLIRKADQALLTAENQRNLVAAMHYIAAEAIYHPPNAPPVVGQEEIRKFYLDWFKIPYAGIFRDSDSIVVASSGELAYLIGNSHIDLKSDTGIHRIEGKYITIWRKVNGQWLCAAVSWNGND